MTVKFVGLMTGAMLLASVGLANAKGPLMTDAQLDRVTAGTANSLEFQKQIDSQSNNQVNFQANVNINDQFQKEALILVLSAVAGNSASLGFDNEAVGPNTNVQGTLSQIAIAGQSFVADGSLCGRSQQIAQCECRHWQPDKRTGAPRNQAGRSFAK